MGEKKGNGMVGNGDYMLAALKRYFGFDSFRPGQEEAVGAVISGRDVMAVMPTGGGKSVCYQLPAARPGTFTLVVTPLRALMRDQVRHLRSRGIPAALIDSGLDEKERAEVYGRALSGELRILYVAPERLHAPDFADFSHRIRISLLAVDEAHCVLHWGSDFRPSYMRIGEFIDSLSPRPVTMALTATASRTQAGEIRELLHLADPVTVTTDADRPNLRLAVVRARPGERLEAMIAWAKRHKGSGIIYKENRKGCERLAETLRSEGIDAMSAYCETRRCLRRTILAMFDPPGTRRDDCSNCSNCQADGREIVKKPASNPYRRRRRTTPETGEWQDEPMGRESIRIACRYIANIQRELGHGVRPSVLAAALHGSTRRSVTEQGLELIDGHGAFSTRSRPAVRNMIGTLEAIQAIDTRTGLVEPGPLFDIYLGGDR